MLFSEIPKSRGANSEKVSFQLLALVSLVYDGFLSSVERYVVMNFFFVGSHRSGAGGAGTHSGNGSHWEWERASNSTKREGSDVQ